jgi:hypothetical protein
VWCCAVVLALVSPALPGSSTTAPTSLPPSGTASSGPSAPSTGPASSSQATTPSPVSTQGLAPPQSTPPASTSSASAGLTPDPAATPAPLTVDPTTGDPTPYDEPVTPPDNDPTRFRFHGRGTIAIGVGASGRFDTVVFGDPAGDRRSHGYLVHNTGSVAAWLRAVGYAERTTAKGSPLFFILPDIALSFHLGGTGTKRDSLAADNGHDVYRRGAYLGMQGHANFSGGVATSGRFGVYGKGSLGARYLLGGATSEGNYGLFPLGVGVGLRAAIRPDVTLLVGPKADAVLGVQGIGGWSRMTQLAPGVDLVLQAKTKRETYVSLIATADVTALGRTYGGQRIFGRATLDVGVPMTPGLRMSLLATYTGWRATATPNSSQFAPEGQTWGAHTLLFGVGIGL